MRRVLVCGFVVLVLLVIGGLSATDKAAAADEFPQNNAWYQATPSVVWCGDEDSTTTFEVHIVERSDVARVWMTELGTDEDEGRAELFDDGTHGDIAAGDGIFTLGDVVLPCEVDRFFDFGWDRWLGFLRVELRDGTQIGNNYGLFVGLVDPAYKNQFEVTELAPGITATAYGVFLEDTDHEVIDDYPVSSVYCGTTNFVAYQKLYSVFGDDFDFASVMPGMVVFRPENLAENVPYNVLVANEVQHIGIDLFDNSAVFGSAGRLKSATFQSFATIAIFDHEIAHTWGAAIGQSLELLSPIYTWDVDQGHWNENADMEGQLGAYFNDEGAVGHFSHLGGETWQLISNHTTEKYSPLELYVMGLVPPEQVPPIQILESPDVTDTLNISAESYRTVTIEEIMAAEGGARIPSSDESQKDFTMAFIVTQDRPFDDAARAFFSLMSYQLASKDGPTEARPNLSPFYWATGERATIETMLPLDLTTPLMPGQTEEVAEVPEPDVEETIETAAPTTATTVEEQVAEDAVAQEPPPVDEAIEETVEDSSAGRNLLLIGILVGLVVVPASFFAGRRLRG